MLVAVAVEVLVAVAVEVLVAVAVLVEAVVEVLVMAAAATGRVVGWKVEGSMASGNGVCGE